MLLDSHRIFTWFIYTLKWLFCTCPLLRPLKHLSLYSHSQPMTFLPVLFHNKIKAIQENFYKFSAWSLFTYLHFTQLFSFCYSRWLVQSFIEDQASMFAFDYVLHSLSLLAYSGLHSNSSLCFPHHQYFSLVDRYV